MTRYVMVADLERCVGCQACTAACLQPAICSESPFISDRLAHISAFSIHIGVELTDPSRTPYAHS